MTEQANERMQLTSAAQAKDARSSLSHHDREAIFTKVCRLVETEHFNPKLNDVDWDSVVEARRDRILEIESLAAC